MWNNPGTNQDIPGRPPSHASDDRRPKEHDTNVLATNRGPQLRILQGRILMQKQTPVSIRRSKCTKRNLAPTEQPAIPQRYFGIRVRPQFPVSGFVQISMMPDVAFAINTEGYKNQSSDEAANADAQATRSAKTVVNRFMEAAGPTEVTIGSDCDPEDSHNPGIRGPLNRECVNRDDTDGRKYQSWNRGYDARCVCHQ